MVRKILDDIEWVKKNLSKDNDVYGILVLSTASEELRDAITQLPNLKLFQYEVNYILSEVV